MSGFDDQGEESETPEPAQDQPAPDQAAADQSPATDQSTAGDQSPAADQSTADQSTADQSTADQPTADQPTADQETPAAEEQPAAADDQAAPEEQQAAPADDQPAQAQDDQPAPADAQADAPADAPAFGEVSVSVDPDAGEQSAYSIQVPTDATITLTWSTSNATRVQIDPLGTFDANGSTTLPATDASYQLTALSDGGSSSDPWPLEVHTHPPDEVVSGHVDLSSGIAAIVSFQALKDEEPVSDVDAGDEVTFELICSDACESATIAGKPVDLSPTSDGHQKARLPIDMTADNGGAYEAQVMKGGEVADSGSVTVEVRAPAEAEKPEQPEEPEEKPEAPEAPAAEEGDDDEAKKKFEEQGKKLEEENADPANPQEEKEDGEKKDEDSKLISKLGGGVKVEFEIFKWPEEEGEGDEEASGTVAPAAGVAEDRDALSYFKLGGSLKVEVSCGEIELDRDHADFTPQQALEEAAKAFKEDSSLWRNMLKQADSPLEMLLVNHVVGRIEVEGLEGGFEYNPQDEGSWGLKLGLGTVKFIDLQGELKAEFTLAQSEAEAAKAVFKGDPDPGTERKLKFGVLSLGGEFAAFTGPDLPMRNGIAIKTPSVTIGAELEVEPNWARIGKLIVEQLEDWAEDAMAELGEDGVGLAVFDFALATAAIYAVGKGAWLEWNAINAQKDLERLQDQVAPKEDEICKGFLKGVATLVREHPEPEKTPFGAGMQLGARAKYEVGQKLRGKVNDNSFDDEVVRRTSDPQVQQDLLQKMKASGKVRSVAQCLAFAKWADDYSAQPLNVKQSAWSTLFQHDPQTLVEQRTLLKAIGPDDYRKFYGEPPPASKVGDITL